MKFRKKLRKLVFNILACNLAESITKSCIADEVLAHLMGQAMSCICEGVGEQAKNHICLEFEVMKCKTVKKHELTDQVMGCLNQ